MSTRLITKFEHRIQNVKPVSAGSFGRSLIVAPHPDDETLGCGGTAALLLEEKIEVNFLFVSDGTMSHPNSKKFPAPKLRHLRESEAVKAVKILGGNQKNTEFLALPDRGVPTVKSPYFESVVRQMVKYLEFLAPDTIFVPWQNDPHPDHQASWQIFHEAVSRIKDGPRMLQYPVWLWEMGSDQDIVFIDKMQIITVDITETMEKKHQALAAHQSQISGIIDDDPDGFQLSGQAIAHFNNNREVFFEFK